MTDEVLEVPGSLETPKREPRSVNLLCAYLAVQFILTLPVLAIGGIGVVAILLQPGELLSPWGMWAVSFGVWVLFQSIMSPQMGFGLVSRKPRGWAVMFALLFCRSAALTTFMTLLIANGFLREGAVAVLGLSWVLVHLSLTIAHFRSREWYSVGRREGWRTVRSEAGWLLILGFPMEALPLFLLKPLQLDL